MAVQVASLFGVLRMQDDQFRSSVRNARGAMLGLGEGMQRLGSNVSSLGTSLTGLAAPAAAAFGLATREAIAFDKSITDIGAVLGLTRQEMDGLNAELLEIGGNRRAGPQAVVAAFYDIVGGVADASTHMAILNAALDTAEAGNANLTATTSGLISVMNSYSFAADKASYVSDVFTRVVGVGVGTMDEFVSAIGPIAGIAAQTGVSFTELGASAAFLTTKGFSASQSATRIQAAITALIKPNQAMEAALKSAGLESGSWALKNLGLVETLRRLDTAMGGSTDEMAAALGTTEALGATMALLGDDFQGFSYDFASGLEGATAAAQGIQNMSDQAQLDLLNSQMSELAITAGNALVPALLDLVTQVRPIIDNIIAWVQQNPELVAQIGMIVAAVAGLGAVLIPAGMAISAIGAIIGVIASPIGIVIAAIAALAAAYFTNFGGIRDFIDTEISPRLQAFFGFLGEVWETSIRPELEKLYNWFMSDGLPAIKDLIVNEILPKVDEFFQFLADTWTLVEPALSDIKNWFTSSGLPAIRNIIEGAYNDVFLPFVNLLKDAWTGIEPGLKSMKDWIVQNMPAIKNAVKPIIDTFQKLIDKVNELVDAAGGLQGLLMAVGTGGVTLPASSSLSGRASGGPVTSGRPYIVGERGPELFTPSQSGMITPNGGEGITINVTVSERQVLTAAEAERNGNILGGAIREKMLSRGLA